MNLNFMVHTRIDRLYDVKEHDFRSAQAIIDFNKNKNTPLEITVNHKLYNLNWLNCHKNLIIRNDCFNFKFIGDRTDVAYLQT